MHHRVQIFVVESCLDPIKGQLSVIVEGIFGHSGKVISRLSKEND